MRKDGHCLFHSIVHILSEAGWADRVRARLKIELDAAPLRSASCRLLLATVEALPASGEDGVGRILEQEAQAIGRGGWGGGLSLTVLCETLGYRIGVVEYREGKYGPAHVQSQLDKGQAKYVYPIGVHSGEYLGTLLNRTSASGCGFHFDVLEAPRRGKRPHAGSPVAPLPEAPELAGDGERSLRGCLEVGDELAAALAAAKELLTPQEAVTSRAVREQTVACACKPPGDVLRQHLVVAVSRLPPTVLYDGRRRAPATAEEIASSLRDVNGDLLLDGIFSPFELLRLVIDAGYGRAAARFAFFFPGGGLPASRTEAEDARLAAASAAMAELPPDAQLSTLSAEERSRAIGASLCGAIAHLGEQRTAELTALFLEGCDANGLLELLRSADAGRLLSSLHDARAVLAARDAKAGEDRAAAAVAVAAAAEAEDAAVAAAAAEATRAAASDGGGYVAYKKADYAHALSRSDTDVQMYLFETFGGWCNAVKRLFYQMKDKVRNKLSKRQHEDEASWSTRSWLSLQAQRMSVALQLAAAEEIATELRLAAASEDAAVA